MFKQLAGSPAQSCVNFARGIAVLSGADVQNAAAEALATTSASVPAEWPAKQRSRDGDAGHHVTLFTKADLQAAIETLRDSPESLQQVWPEQVARPEPTEASILEAVGRIIEAHPTGLTWFSCGEGRAREGTCEASFLVVLWPAGAAVRRALGLCARDFHITLGFSNQDVHTKSKGLDSLTAVAPCVNAHELLDAADEQLLKEDVEGCYELASTALSKALAAGVWLPERRARRLLCQVSGRRSLHEEVLSHSAQLLEFDAKDEIAQRLRAFAFVMLGSYEEALVELQRAQELIDKVAASESEAVQKKLTQAEVMCRKKTSCNGYKVRTPPVAKLEACENDNYPSTPHLPFSPGVSSDDKKLGDCTELLKHEVIVTEKLDGGNCCIKEGVVYARTHSHPASHPSFSAVKELTQTFFEDLGGLELYGENMAAEHSVSYGNLQAYFYLFAIRRTQDGRWLAWEDVVDMAARLNIPTVPLRFCGHLESPARLRKLIETWAAEPSAAGRDTKPEGFVVRRRAAFDHCNFAESISKYVRANFNQLDGTSKRNWTAAKLGDALPAPSVVVGEAVHAATSSKSK